MTALFVPPLYCSGQPKRPKEMRVSLVQPTKQPKRLCWRCGLAPPPGVAALSWATCLAAFAPESQTTATASRQGGGPEAGDRRDRRAVHSAVVSRLWFLAPQDWVRGSEELFCFALRTLRGSGKKKLNKIRPGFKGSRVAGTRRVGLPRLSHGSLNDCRILVDSFS